MSIFLARVISIIANPIFILVGLPFFLVFKATRNIDEAWRWTFYTWAFLFLFVLFVVFGVRRKFFADIDVSNRQQRPLLYMAGAILSFLYVIGLSFLQAPRILYITIIGVMLGITVGAIVNMRIKASVHVAALAALLSALSVVYKGYYIVSLLLIPLVCWARIKLKRHTLPEVLTGGIIGSLLSLIMYFSAKSFLAL